MKARYVQPRWDNDGHMAGLIKGEWYDVEFAIIRRTAPEGGWTVFMYLM